MRHPTDGTLRRLLDEPAGVADTDRDHVAGCPVCLSELATAQQDAALTGAALDVEVDVDVDAGWRRLSAAVAADEQRRRPAPAARRWRPALRLPVLRSPVLAGVLVLALVAGAGTAAAADWLQIFRTEEIAPVAVSQSDLVDLPDLTAYGEVATTSEPNVHEVAGAAEAEQATGLTAPTVGPLPKGVTGQPRFLAGGKLSAVFTFSAAKSKQTAAAAGKTLPPVPEGLDDSRFRLSAGPVLAQAWISEAHGKPRLIVARAVAPSAASSGIPFATARDYLLSLPGLPPNVAAQLRSFSGDGTTLPLPVATAQMTSSTADVGGRPATVLTSRDGAMSGVVWVRDGVVTAVAGALRADEVLTVARGLR
jgi:hypothetical protein